MARIFISYRRDDSDFLVSRLVEELRKHFPADQVFQDIASIHPGVDFKVTLDDALATAGVMLAVIGRRWLSAADKRGRRRLDLAADFVRQEIAESLRRPGVRVWPLLVDGAEMPSEEELPDSLKALHFRQAFELTVRHWDKDVAQLVETLKRAQIEEEARREIEEEARRRAEEESKRREEEARAAQEEAERKASEEEKRGRVGEARKIGKTPALDTAPLLSVVELWPGTVFRDAPNTPEMVVIPPGSYVMGSGEKTSWLNRLHGNFGAPEHVVTIGRPFAVGKYPVTFDEWDLFLKAGGTEYKPEDKGWGRGKRPVICVNWADAQAYVIWLYKKTGKHYRLLSEAEWEYAARAGTTTRYPWGDELGTNRANSPDSGSQWSNMQTSPVGSFEPNAFGLYDMIGNVWEWVQDRWKASYVGAPSDGTAREESAFFGMRIKRGGSWNAFPEFVHVAFRQYAYHTTTTESRGYDVGFRLARTL